MGKLNISTNNENWIQTLNDIKNKDLNKITLQGFHHPIDIAILLSFFYPIRKSIDFYIRENYLSRMNFYKLLDLKEQENFERHNQENNLIEACFIKTRDDTANFDDKLKIVLKTHLQTKANLVYGILTATHEVSDNILEHSQEGKFNVDDKALEKPGFACAQFYPKSSCLRVGISDYGLGIIATLKNKLHALNDAEILQKSFERNVTRFDEDRGNGLGVLKELALESDGSIFCISNGYQIIFDNKNKQGKIIKIDSTLKGTHLDIKINCQNELDVKKIFKYNAEDFDEFDDMIL